MALYDTHASILYFRSVGQLWSRTDYICGQSPDRQEKIGVRRTINAFYSLS